MLEAIVIIIALGGLEIALWMADQSGKPSSGDSRSNLGGARSFERRDSPEAFGLPLGSQN